MEAIVSLTVGILIACGVYLVLRARTFPVILGLNLIGFGVNLFLFAMGRLHTALPPLISKGRMEYADPLPQALVLTAIVIGFAMIAFVVVLALRADEELKTDHVDGRLDNPS